MRLKAGYYKELGVSINGDGRAYPINLDAMTTAALELWGIGRDTRTIAKLLILPEAAIYNALARRRGHLSSTSKRRRA